MLANFKRAFKDHWRHLVNGFWFVPLLISLLGPLLALFFLALDHYVGEVDRTFLFSGGAAEASIILSTIAGALITVVALTFSITIIVLTTLPDSSSQNQSFFPAISITVAMILGSLGLVLLLIFIHHTGSVIQVTDITARIAMQTMQAMDPQYQTLISEPLEAETSSPIRTRYVEEIPARFCATRPGYIQRIVFSHLSNILQRPGFYLYLPVCPGDFVTEETVIAEVWPAQAADMACRKAIFDSIYIERERDFYQDALFGIRQLADIALRALSPAVNDPTTGVLCIKYLQAVFEHFMRGQPQPNVFHMANGASILEVRQPTFPEYLEMFPEIGHYAGGNTRVNNALLMAMQKIMELAEQLNLKEYQALLTELMSTMAAQNRIDSGVM